MYGQMGAFVQRKQFLLVRRSLAKHLNIFVGLTDQAQNAEIMVEKEEDQKEKVL